MSGKRPGRVEIFFVRRDPIDCDLVLRGRQVELAGADHLPQPVLQGIFHVGIPDGTGIGLRPKIPDVIGPAKRRSALSPSLALQTSEAATGRTAPGVSSKGGIALRSAGRAASHKISHQCKKTLKPTMVAVAAPEDPDARSCRSSQGPGTYNAAIALLAA